MTLVLPLRLEGCQILDANNWPIALVRGEMAEYRTRGAEIVAAVNGRVELLGLIERSVREAIQQPIASLDKFEEHYTRLRASHADLLAAAKAALSDGSLAVLPSMHFNAFVAAITKAEQA